MLCKVLIFLAVGLNALAAAENLDPIIHRLSQDDLLVEYTLKIEVNDTEPLTEYCLWTGWELNNSSGLDERVFQPANATTQDGKGYCVLIIDNFPDEYNGKMVMLSYRGMDFIVEVNIESNYEEILLCLLFASVAILILLICCFIYLKSFNHARLMLYSS